MTLKGIDVSGWQQGINLAAVPADFVIMKATGGVSFVSNDCDRQYQQAKKSDRLRGVYHFANDDNRRSSATAEADWFVDNTVGYHDGETLLVLDFEQQALPLGPAWAKAFMDRVHSRTGIKPIIYLQGSEAAQAKYDVLVKADYGLWIAHWTVAGHTAHVTPPAAMGSRWPFAFIHQYSDKGRLPGYGGDLDLNIAHGDRATWMKYAAKGGKVQPAPKPNPTPTPAPKPSSGGTYTVRSGDTLSGIAGKYGLGWQALYDANRGAIGSDPNRIHAGLVLTIPGGGSSKRTYTVQRGDTLSGIASKYGTTWQALQQANGIANANLIYAGQVLTIP